MVANLFAHGEAEAVEKPSDRWGSRPIQQSMSFAALWCVRMLDTRILRDAVMADPRPRMLFWRLGCQLTARRLSSGWATDPERCAYGETTSHVPRAAYHLPSCPEIPDQSEDRHATVGKTKRAPIFQMCLRLMFITRRSIGKRRARATRAGLSCALPTPPPNRPCRSLRSCQAERLMIV